MTKIYEVIPILMFQVCKVGNVYGHFVPSKTWVSLVCSKILSIEPRCCTTDLMILALIIEASDPELFHDLAEDLVLALQDDAVCLKIDVRKAFA